MVAAETAGPATTLPTHNSNLSHLSPLSSRPERSEVEGSNRQTLADISVLISPDGVSQFWVVKQLVTSE
jgi:hypothetical protein